MTTPDFEAWASAEALSAHEISCLCAGIEPTPTGEMPRIPPDAETDAVQEDIDTAYKRVHLLLSKAITEQKIDITPSGRIPPAIAMNYLLRIATEKGWGNWFDRCEFLASVAKVSSAEKAAKKPADDDKTKLIEALKKEIEQLKLRSLYSTPMLEAVYKVIDTFYANTTAYPKQETVFAFIENLPAPEGAPWSEKKKSAIWAVASHPSQAIGGQKKRPKRTSEAQRA